MSRLTTVLAVVAGAIAGGVVGLVASSGGSSSSTKTVTTIVRSNSSGSSVPASLSKAQASSNQGLTINQIYNMDSPGVVDIDVTSEQPTSSGGGFFGFGGGSSGGQQLEQGEGAGVVYDSSGYIITDEHVIANATSVKVNFWNGKSYSAKVIGSDPSTDVGVIKVDAPASELHPLTFANSNNAEVGDPVVAIGSPFSLPETVTAGIVSQVGRSIEAPNGFTIVGAIQTDAAINPGNSGGPLLDAGGQVLGLNDQIETNGSSDQNAGVGFSTPGDPDQQIANELIAGEKVEHPYVGVCLQSTIGSDSTGGAEIAESAAEDCAAPIAPGSPAAHSGLEPGDVITAIDGKPVTNTESFISTIGTYKPGQTVTLTVKRDGSTKQIKLALTTRPAEAPTG